MNERMTQRCDQLFKLGLQYNGDSYVGKTDETKDINFHWTDIQCDTDKDWDRSIKEVKKELTRRGVSFEE